MGIDDPVVNHVDVALAFLDEGEPELEAVGEFDHRVHDVGGYRVLVDDDVADGRAGAIHHDEAVGTENVENARLSYEVEIAAGREKNLDSFLLKGLHGIDG